MPIQITPEEIAGLAIIVALMFAAYWYVYGEDQWPPE